MVILTRSLYFMFTYITEMLLSVREGTANILCASLCYLSNQTLVFKRLSKAVSTSVLDSMAVEELQYNVSMFSGGPASFL